MNEEVFISGCLHFDHYGVAIHANRTPWVYPNPNYNPESPKHFKNNNPWAVNLEQHNEDLIDNWNKMVPKKARTIILGDFAWKDHKKFIQALNGKKILVTGNHDKMNQDALRHFTEVHEMGCRKRIEGQDVTFCHYAMRSWASSCWGSWQIYSHSHGRMPEFDNMFSCDGGTDVWGFAPAPWGAFVEKMKRIQDKIDAAGGRFVDGEFKASGYYDKDPNQRMLGTRAKNKEIMQYLGYDIDERMWPTELIPQEAK